MFTQCPDCQTTFRVSDKILQQADGRVRCGGCGNPFNALEHLSKKDDDQADESTSDQNKNLLETLDKLAGADVDLEDTGTEWRDREKSDEGDSEDEASETAAMHGRQDDLPRPAPDEQESLDLPETEPPHTKSSERRYDDDTILPDDFGEEDDLDELPFLEAEIPKRRAEDREATQDTGECDDAQVDLADAELRIGRRDEHSHLRLGRGQSVGEGEPLAQDLVARLGREGRLQEAVAEQRFARGEPEHRNLLGL